MRNYTRSPSRRCRWSSVPAAIHGARRRSRPLAAPPRTIELREDGSPFIALNIWVSSGSAADPKGKEGLASLTAALLTGGATTQDSLEQILREALPDGGRLRRVGRQGDDQHHRPRPPRQPRGLLRRCSATPSSRRRSATPTSIASRRSG